MEVALGVYISWLALAQQRLLETTIHFLLTEKSSDRPAARESFRMIDISALSFACIEQQQKRTLAFGSAAILRLTYYIARSIGQQFRMWHRRYVRCVA